MALRPEGKEKTLTRLRKWSFPPYKKKKQLPAGRMKLKTDGCAKGSPGPLGIGGIARDDQGGYEIKDGILETDSAEALSLITNAEIEDHP
ncbi:unnamed protein product [Lupinus luteus]|uniref:RNase H type-1 domain-containing protein n=1 Tax=Lupinus luteus TaxID=3873 RepID=A0AAV1W6T3_LUPLU